MTVVPRAPEYGCFTMHNIVLPDGTETLPGVPPVAGSALTRTALAALAMVFPAEPGTLRRYAPNVTVADLGCGEGGHSAAFAAEGYDVTGVEARTENVVCCELVRRAFPRLGLRFALTDAADVGLYGEFDAVFCAGLLYHLPDPVAMLRAISAACTKLLILQSFTTPAPDARHEGYLGSWDWEPGLGQRDRQARWLSVAEDGRSFWLTRTELVRAVRDAGFPLVLEVPEDPADPFTDQVRTAPGAGVVLLGVKP